MSDERLRQAERALATSDGDGRARLDLWKEQRRAGVPSPFPFDFQIEEHGEGYSGWSVRAAKPGTQALPWDGKTGVAYVYWRGEEHESYTFDNAYWLVGLEDGRFALVSRLESGTCSSCGSASDEATIGYTLEEVVVFGMGDRERRLAGLESVA